MKTAIYIFSAFLFFSTVCQGQKGIEKKAKIDYEGLAYQDAINAYQNLVEKGNTGQEIFQNLGNSNYLNANYEEAAKWYKELFAIDTIEVDADYYYKYAQALKSLGDYQGSDTWMERFLEKSSGDKRAVQFTDNRDYLKKIKENSGRYNIRLSDMNSKSSDFAPSFFNGGLVFSSARDTGITARRVHEWNKSAFLNLYQGQVGDDGKVANVQRFSRNLNAITHESSTAFSKDGKTLYFTRNNSENGRRFSRDDQGVSRLKIYKAEWVNGEWDNIVELPFNGEGFSTAHPALDEKNSKLYFASDRPGTYGASDLWVVDLLENGTYGAPKNLGPSINTEDRETFPFVTDDGILYFASDGHPGLGGLDIYATEIDGNSDTGVVNLGEPINSDEDDFTFIIDTATKRGYFSSNRPEGVGGDDIYEFTETDPLVFKCMATITGVVKNSEDGSILTNANVTILSDSGSVVATAVSDAAGMFTTSFECVGNSYTANGIKTDFKEGTSGFALDGQDPEVNVELFLEPKVKVAAAGTDLGVLLDLNPIYFDLNKSNIRPDAALELQKVLDYMKQFQDISIAIGSHTDSRGSDSYNRNLSERRAKSTMQWLVANGIDAKRLSSQGFGESKLLNNCSNGVKCSNAQHDVNRRSEFIVR